MVDCEDNDCEMECVEVCDDGQDNDQDGLADCDDGLTDCADDARSCAEDCETDADDDGDGLIGCADPDCFDASCTEDCADGWDNDQDLVADCWDSDCFGPECAEICVDGRDNDADGATDCQDDDCIGPECSAQETRARVTGGSGQLTRENWWVAVRAPNTGTGSTYSSGSVGCGEFPNNSHELFRDSITGSVSGEVEATTASGAIETCNWRAQIDFAGRHDLAEPVQFDSVEVDSADRCGITGTSFLPRRLRAYSSDRINLTSTTNNWMVFGYGSQIESNTASNSTRTQTYINGCLLTVDASTGRRRIWSMTFQPGYNGTFTHTP